MLELNMEMVQEYLQWGFAVGIIVAIIYLAAICQRLRRLNRTLARIANRVQRYFDVIAMEEDAAQKQEATQKRQSRACCSKERLSEPCLEESQVASMSESEEEALHSVLQEYFS